MKKIFAISAFALASQAVFANDHAHNRIADSVTIYGTLDAGYSKETGTNAGIRFNNSKTSHIGLRATENIGGGTTAGAVIEVGIDPEGKFGGQRPTYVFLGNQGFGEIKLGAVHTLGHELLRETSPSYGANVLGSIYNGRDPEYDYGGRATALRYDVAPLGPVKLGAYYGINATKDESSRQARNYGVSVSIGNADGKIGYVYQNSENIITHANTYSDVKENYNSFKLIPYTTNHRTTNHIVAGEYTFGIFTPSIAAIKQHIYIDSGGNKIDRNQYQAGGRLAITPTIYAFGSYTQGDSTLNDLKVNTKGYQAGVGYNLSKRTNLYGIYGAEKYTGSNGFIASQAEQYTIGLKHSF